MALILRMALMGTVLGLATVSCKTSNPDAFTRIDSMTTTSSGVKEPRQSRTGLPLTWKIGDVDGRFGLSDAAIRGVIDRAADLWEKEAGRELFAYDDSFGFPVHFVFDHRQEMVANSKASEDGLERAESDLNELGRTRGAAEREFLRARARLEGAQRAFSARLDAYNQRVGIVNRSGGASKAEAAQLDAEKAQLADERSQLEDERFGVLNLQEQVNRLSREFNAMAARNRDMVREHNRRFAGIMQKIGECVRTNFGVREITVFAFENEDHLAIVLAHELGHALGLDHVTGSGALMSEVESGKEGSKTLKLTERDRAELRRKLGERAGAS